MPRRNKSATIKRVTYILDCSRKRSYENEKQAIDAADYQMLMNMNLEIRHYKCNLCSKWHLTRQIDK